MATQSPDTASETQSAPWSGAVIPMAGAGAAAVVRIPVPGTQGLAIQLDAPGGYKGSTSTLFFVEDPGSKMGRQLRLDFGKRPVGNGKFVIDYHWNQKSTFPTFGIPDHAPAGAVGRYLYGAARYFRYGGRFLGIVGATIDAVSIVQADKPLRRATQVVAGWAGAWAGCKVVGAAGGAGGFVAGTEFPVVGNAAGAAIGGIGGCLIGGATGYWAGSEIAGIVYDWAATTRFQPLMAASEAEVHGWLHMEAH